MSEPPAKRRKLTSAAKKAGPAKRRKKAHLLDGAEINVEVDIFDSNQDDITQSLAWWKKTRHLLPASVRTKPEPVKVSLKKKVEYGLFVEEEGNCFSFINSLLISRHLVKCPREIDWLSPYAPPDLTPTLAGLPDEVLRLILFHFANSFDDHGEYPYMLVSKRWYSLLNHPDVCLNPMVKYTKEDPQKILQEWMTDLKNPPGQRLFSLPLALALETTGRLDELQPLFPGHINIEFLAELLDVHFSSLAILMIGPTLRNFNQNVWFVDLPPPKPFLVDSLSADPTKVTEVVTEKERGYSKLLQYSTQALVDFPTIVRDYSKIYKFLNSNLDLAETMHLEEESLRIPPGDAPIDDLISYYIFLLRYSPRPIGKEAMRKLLKIGWKAIPALIQNLSNPTLTILIKEGELVNVGYMCLKVLMMISCFYTSSTRTSSNHVEFTNQMVVKHATSFERSCQKKGVGRHLAGLVIENCDPDALIFLDIYNKPENHAVLLQEFAAWKPSGQKVGERHIYSACAVAKLLNAYNTDKRALIDALWPRWCRYENERKLSLTRLPWTTCLLFCHSELEDDQLDRLRGYVEAITEQEMIAAIPLSLVTPIAESWCLVTILSRQVSIIAKLKSFLNPNVLALEFTVAKSFMINLMLNNFKSFTLNVKECALGIAAALLPSLQDTDFDPNATAAARTCDEAAVVISRVTREFLGDLPFKPNQSVSQRDQQILVLREKSVAWLIAEGFEALTRFEVITSIKRYNGDLKIGTSVPEQSVLEELAKVKHIYEEATFEESLSNIHKLSGEQLEEVKAVEIKLTQLGIDCIPFLTKEINSSNRGGIQFISGLMVHLLMVVNTVSLRGPSVSHRLLELMLTKLPGQSLYLNELVAVVAQWNVNYPGHPLFCTIERWELNPPDSIGIDITLKVAVCRHDLREISLGTHLVCGPTRKFQEFGLSLTPATPSNNEKLTSTTYNIVATYNALLMEKPVQPQPFSRGSGLVIRIQPQFDQVEDGE